MERLFSICNPDLFCHYEYATFLQRQIVCTHPTHDAPHAIVYADVNDYLALLNPRESVCMAQAFAERTGIVDNLKCKFPVENIPGVVPLRADIFVYYDVLIQCIQMLGIMNSYFIDYHPSSLFDRNATLNIKIVDGFIERFTKMVQQHPEQDVQVAELLNFMIGHLVKVSKNTNSLVTYFLEVYAPYVRKLNYHVPTASQTIDSGITLEKFKIINLNANEIRSAFSPYSLQFELMYVLVYTYLFTENLDVVVGVIFDFFSSIFHGTFVTVDRQKYRRYLDQCLSRVRNNSNLYKRVKSFERGGGFSNDISLDCLKDLEQIHKIYSANFAQKFWSADDTSQEIIAYAESQTFPAILFSEDNDAEYYGYMMSYPILKRGFNSKTGTFVKNTVSQCRAICQFVKEFINRFLEFEKDIDYWTIDLFQLFLSADENFKRTFNNFIELFKN